MSRAEEQRAEEQSFRVSKVSKKEHPETLKL
jgi:hypothetical protein